MEYRVLAKKFKDVPDLTFWLDRMGEQYWELITVKWDKKGLSGLFVFKNDQCLYESADEVSEEETEYEYFEESEEDGEQVE